MTALSFATAVGASIFVIASSWPEGGAPLGLPVWSHLLLLAAVTFEIVFRVWKITFSAKAIGVNASFGVAARTVLGGDFAAAITPSRSGAEPARFLAMREAGIPVPSVLLILFLELFLEMVSLAVLAVAFGIIWHDQAGVVRGILITVGLYSSGVLGAGAFGLLLANRRAHGPRPAWVRRIGIGSGTWRRVQLSLRQLRGSVTAMRSAHVGLMLTSLGFSIVHVLGRLSILPIVAWSYGESPPMSAMILWPMALLYGAAIAPAPGGGGVVEFAFKAALGGVLSAQLIPAALIWWRAYSFYIYILIGAVAAGRTVMRALRQRERRRGHVHEGVTAASPSATGS